jgi:hypothetical protein
MARSKRFHMPLLRKRVSVRTNGTPRSILLIDENMKGDVYLRIKSGTQVGIPPNEIPVLQDRYSIHPSPKSPTYTTLKSTFELANGLKRTSVALTDAVKEKNGFAHLFSHRSSDLQAPLYDVPTDDIDTIELGDFDNSQYALIVGAFIGHPASVFEASGNEIINSMLSDHFQIVIANLWVNKDVRYSLAQRDFRGRSRSLRPGLRLMLCLGQSGYDRTAVFLWSFRIPEILAGDTS